ncbi:MAG: ATP-binding protein, partial [Pseudomonadota bacterium]|nr:ATP-binding protein [Pseudomonadota bacterium]
MRGWRRVDWLYVELPQARPGSLNAYLIGAVAAGLATLLRLALDPWVHGIYFITFLPAIIGVALVCGFGAGLVTVVLSGAAARYFVVPPRGSFDDGTVEGWIALAVFLATGTMIVLVVGAMRLAIGRYRRLSATLRRRVQERTEELENAQATLVQAQKMEAVGQLTGGIAHDFNNMLAVVIGNLDIVQRRLAQGRSDVFRQLENAMDGAQRAAALTRRLLVFARRQPLEPAVCEINRLLNDLSELLRRTLGEKIRIEAALAKGTWPIRVDPAQLESAIINLAINARDAMAGGGTLRIETANVSVPDEGAALPGGPAPGDYVMVTVTDSGAGMSPEVAARAFEPFFTTKEPGRGTGLGLSQVYGFVKQSGGHVKIYSEASQGTTVKVYLPRVFGEANAAMRQPVEARARGNADEVVLVVEDDEGVRALTCQMVRELGYGCLE